MPHSPARRDAARVLLGGFVRDLAYRIAQVAIPVVVLLQTHSVRAVGVVGGVAALPVLLSPWWATSARHWADSGLRLAVLTTGEAIAFALIPLSASVDLMNVWTLALADVAIGVFEALTIPGQSALIADVGDRLSKSAAVTLLTWQDGLRRITMIVGPALGAVAVGFGWTTSLLWAVAAVLASTGWLAAGVRGGPVLDDAARPTIRSALAGRPAVVRGWVMRGASCVTWFAFTLGLAVRGVEAGRPGVVYAWGLTGYGLGSLAATIVSPAINRRCAPIPVATAAWTAGGVAWVLLAGTESLPLTALIAAGAGATLVIGIAAVNRVITTTSTGPERRTLLSGQAVVVNAGSSLGMLAGGSVIAALGVSRTLLVAGVTTTATALTAGLARR